MILVGQSIHSRFIDGNLSKLETELEQIQAAGADSCELILHCLDVVVGGRVVAPQQEAVLKILQKYKLQYTMHMPYDINFHTKDYLDLYQAVFEAGIDFAKAAGVRALVHHFGRGPSTDGILQEAQIIKALAQRANGMLFCLENPTFFGFSGHSAGKNQKTMIDFLKQLDQENVRLTFDVGHSFLNHHGKKDLLLQELEALLPYLGHVHLHDNFGHAFPMLENDYIHRLACGAADLHLPLGWGDVPVPQVFALLKGNFSGVINLEIEERFHSYYKESVDLVRTHLV